jgi:hypothetical protein
MMNDEQLHNLLRRVTPAGPPPDFRARIVAGRQPRTWPWAAAAAAVLVVTAGLQLSTVRTYRRTSRVVAPEHSDRVELPDLRFALGEDESLIRRGELWTEQERRHNAAPETETP